MNGKPLPIHHHWLKNTKTLFVRTKDGMWPVEGREWDGDVTGEEGAGNIVTEGWVKSDNKITSQNNTYWIQTFIVPQKCHTKLTIIMMPWGIEALVVRVRPNPNIDLMLCSIPGGKLITWWIDYQEKDVSENLFQFGKQADINPKNTCVLYICACILQFKVFYITTGFLETTKT